VLRAGQQAAKMAAATCYSCIPVTHIHALEMCSPGRPLDIKSALLICQVTYKIQINVHIEPFDYIMCGVYYTGQIKIDW